jgi:prephenate dehydratase
MSLPERPGSLYEALGLFAQREINLSKLTSRPVPEKAWQYVFYIDFEASLANALGVLDDSGGSRQQRNNPRQLQLNQTKTIY